MMTRAMLICTLMLSAVLGALAADDARHYLLIGDTWETAVKILGKPSGDVVLSEGRVLLFYGQGQLTVQNGVIEKWRDFPLPAPRAQAPTLSPGATTAEVVTALGWPPAAYRVPQADKRVVKEIWDYHTASLTFLNGWLSGWVHASAASISWGKKVPGATLTLGASREDAIAAVGTPDTLEQLAEARTACWHLGADTLTLRADKVIAWENMDRALPLRVAAGGARMPAPALGTSQDAVIAALGLPRAIELRGTLPALWCYDKAALAVDARGQVCAIATPRLQTKMAATKPDLAGWRDLLAWLLAQPHLDYHADIPLTRDMLYQRFLAATNDATLYGKYSSERGNTLYTSLARAGNSRDFLAGVTAALGANSSTSSAQLLNKRVSSAYAAGVKQVAQGYQRYQSDAFTQYLTVGQYVALPDYSGKQGQSVSTALTTLGYIVDIVPSRDTTVTAGLVTDSYPPAGSYLPPQGAVTLYVAQ